MLDGISFIGVDEQTDLDKMWALAELSEGPEIEFGILYSESKMETKDKRYPSKKWIEKLITDYWAETDINSAATSLHLCGSAIEKYLNQDSYLIDLVNKFDRVQLNFSMAKFTETELIDKLMRLTKHVDSMTVLQCNKSKKSFIDTFTKSVPKNDRLLFNILFDGSGGFGRVLEAPEKPFKDFYCGYAGGIGPDTVKEIVEKIDAITNEYYYIDMESQVRVDNYFSLDKCKQVIEIVNSHVGEYDVE